MKFKFIHVIILFAISVLFFNCKDKTIPILLLNDTTTLVDTMKMSSSGASYIIDFEVIGERHSYDLRVDKNNNCTIIMWNNVINGEEVEVGNKGELIFRPNRTGNIDLDFVIKGRKVHSVSTLDMHVLDNLLPLARLSMTQTDLNAPYEVQISAGESYDLDGNYGGGIEEYEFTLVDFYTTSVNNPEINYIFPEPGNYEVQLRVKDNDGEWSPKVSKVIEVI